MRRLALTTATVLALAGCGGSGGGGEKSWAEQADAICAETEKRIRAREPAKSSGDLERVMAAVIEDLKAGRSELKALERPEDRRKTAEPFLRDVDRAIGVAEMVRDKASDSFAVELVGRDARVAGLDLEDHARSAGLDRCGRGASSDAVDAFLMPGYASAVAELVAAVGAASGIANGDPPSDSEFWRRAQSISESNGLSLTAPESIKDAEVDFLRALGRLSGPVSEVAFHYEGIDRLSAGGLRSRVRAAARGLQAAQRQGYALLKATGPPGEALLPRVKVAVRRAG